MKGQMLIDVVSNSLEMAVSGYTSYHLPEQMIRQVVEKVRNALPVSVVNVTYTDQHSENRWVVVVSTSNTEAINVLSKSGKTYFKIIEEIVEESLQQVRLIVDIIEANKEKVK